MSRKKGHSRGNGNGLAALLDEGRYEDWADRLAATLPLSRLGRTALRRWQSCLRDAPSTTARYLLNGHREQRKAANPLYQHGILDDLDAARLLDSFSEVVQQARHNNVDMRLMRTARDLVDQQLQQA